MTVKQNHQPKLKIDLRQQNLAIVFEMSDITCHYLVVEKSFIGSASTCDIRVNSRDAEPLHAQIVPTDEGFIIHDLYTSEGVLLNEHKIDHQAVIEDHDIIGIGARKFQVLVIMQNGDLVSRENQ